MSSVRVVAHANIALAKYWGKAEPEENLPAVPSLSLTLDRLRTHTTVTFDGGLTRDEAFLDGAPAQGRPLARVTELLDRVRLRARTGLRARVETRNEFPTAAGLASSASGFAALALAASRAAGLELPLSEVSALARRSSASAARSLWGGYVELGARAPSAQPVAPAARLPIVMLVAVTSAGTKKVSSTEGMKHTADTSPYYPAWVTSAPAIFAEIREGVLEGDLDRVGVAAERSALAMHASMWAAHPPLRYFSAATLAVLDRVQELRASGLPCYATMDAGPNVKVLTSCAAAAAVGRALEELPEVVELLRCEGGPGARVVEEGEA